MVRHNIVGGRGEQAGGRRRALCRTRSQSGDESDEADVLSEVIGKCDSLAAKMRTELASLLKKARHDVEICMLMQMCS